MTIERQIEAIHTAETYIQEPTAMSDISTKSLHITCNNTTFADLQKLHDHGFSTVIYGADFDESDELAIVLSITDYFEVDDEFEAWKELEETE